jgi:bacillithiol synthase
MPNIVLNEGQRKNLDLIGRDDTLAVVTGQQVGFLGGPVYTIEKIISAVKLAEKLKKIHNGINFVPVFWLEDNDHDNQEASYVHLFDKDYDIVEFNCCPDCIKTDRTMVAEKKFTHEITEIIDNLSLFLPDSAYKPDIMTLMKRIYKPGKSWSDAFVELINEFAGQYGLLILRAAAAINMGLFTQMAYKELSNRGHTDSIIIDANRKLETHGYRIQAKSSSMNLFQHDGPLRLKIEADADNSPGYKIGGHHYSHDDLMKLFKENPASFSPNVLLRPVFQDSILPTAAYITGPSEVAYCSQIKELYDFFDVPMPAFIPRHSATFLDRHAQRFFSKYSRQPEELLRNYDKLASEIAAGLLDNDAQGVINSLGNDLENVFKQLTSIAQKTDKSLEGASQAAFEKALQQFQHIEKKIMTAEKKNNSQLFDKLKKISNFIYPHDSFQERIFSPLNHMNSTGIAEFVNIIYEAFENEPDLHYIVNL